MCVLFPSGLSLDSQLLTASPGQAQNSLENWKGQAVLEEPGRKGRDPDGYGRSSWGREGLRKVKRKQGCVLKEARVCVERTIECEREQGNMGKGKGGTGYEQM